MRNRVGPSGGIGLGLDSSSRRGFGRAQARVTLGAALGVTAGLALFAAPPATAAEATCVEPPMASPVLQDQFKDVAPGVPYESGVPPVKDRPKGHDAILRMVEDQI